MLLDKERHWCEAMCPAAVRIGKNATTHQWPRTVAGTPGNQQHRGHEKNSRLSSKLARQAGFFQPTVLRKIGFAALPRDSR
jgi:hypothetical protein